MKRRDIIAIIGFLLLLVLPLAHLMSVRFQGEVEGYSNPPQLSFKRTLESRSIKEIALGLHREIKKNRDAFTKYFEDNFTWRDSQFKAYSFLHQDVFGENPLPTEVVAGEDGWKFLGNRYSYAVVESKGISVFSETELDRIENTIRWRQNWLEEQGISSYVSVAPNKHTVYGQFLPITKAETPTNLEHLTTRFQNSEVNFMVLSEKFDAHANERLYYKTDSHWNDHGAFYAYQALAERIKKDHPEVTILDLESLDAQPDTAYKMEMARVLSVDLEEAYIKLSKVDSTAVPQSSFLPVPPNYYRNPDWYEYRYSSKANGLKVLIFRDSFSTALKQYLIESFGETVMIWHPIFDKELILSEKPDIVVYQIVERNLDFFLKYE